jgi:hypothetical protein
MKSKQLAMTLALLACAVAALLLRRQFSSPTVNLRPSAAVGEVLADEVGRLLGGAGKIVLLSRQLSKDGPDATGERVASFTVALQHRATLKLAATEWVPRPPAGTMDLGAVTPEQLLAAMEKNPEANALVVFAGLPAYSKSLSDELAARSVKLVAVCGYGPVARRWLESKVLALAVVPRFDDPPADAPAPKTAKEWFDREFQLLTPESLGRLPY